MNSEFNQSEFNQSDLLNKDKLVEWFNRRMEGITTDDMIDNLLETNLQERFLGISGIDSFSSWNNKVQEYMINKYGWTSAIKIDNGLEIYGSTRYYNPYYPWLHTMHDTNLRKMLETKELAYSSKYDLIDLIELLKYMRREYLEPSKPIPATFILKDLYMFDIISIISSILFGAVYTYQEIENSLFYDEVVDHNDTIELDRGPRCYLYNRINGWTSAIKIDNGLEIYGSTRYYNPYYPWLHTMHDTNLRKMLETKELAYSSKYDLIDLIELLKYMRREYLEPSKPIPATFILKDLYMFDIISIISSILFGAVYTYQEIENSLFYDEVVDHNDTIELDRGPRCYLYNRINEMDHLIVINKVYENVNYEYFDDQEDSYLADQGEDIESAIWLFFKDSFKLRYVALAYFPILFGRATLAEMPIEYIPYIIQIESSARRTSIVLPEGKYITNDYFDSNDSPSNESSTSIRIIDDEDHHHSIYREEPNTIERDLWYAALIEKINSMLAEKDKKISEHGILEVSNMLV